MKIPSTNEFIVREICNRMVSATTVERTAAAQLKAMNRNLKLPLTAVTALGGGRPDRRESRDRPIVRIHLLGPMRATTYLGENIVPHGKRARAVLGYLCLAAGLNPNVREGVQRAAMLVQGILRSIRFRSPVRTRLGPIS